MPHIRTGVGTGAFWDPEQSQVQPLFPLREHSLVYPRHLPFMISLLADDDLFLNQHHFSEHGDTVCDARVNAPAEPFMGVMATATQSKDTKQVKIIVREQIAKVRDEDWRKRELERAKKKGRECSD